MTYVVRSPLENEGTYLGEGSKTVGGARGVGDDIVFGLVGIEVDATDKHGGIGRGSRDDDLLGSTLEMGRCLVLCGEDSRRLDNVLVDRLLAYIRYANRQGTGCTSAPLFPQGMFAGSLSP